MLIPATLQKISCWLLHACTGIICSMFQPKFRLSLCKSFQYYTSPVLDVGDSREVT